jgi:N-methylhydantoinase B/oxoprolinase/acetone carboxylase alpha subunit
VIATMPSARIDPVELELFRHILVSIAEEMGVVLRKTSFSANIKERRDYSCAVYDDRGDTVAMGDHMPVHLGAMPLSVRQAIDAFTLGPGDIVILNDPFRGGTHLPDITAVAPVFARGARRGGRPAFYLATRAHHADVGGMSPGSMPLAREIYQEGLRLPPVRLYRGGRLEEDLMNVVLANVRTPEERRGDLLAQVMAIHRGEARLAELVKKHSIEEVHRYMRALEDYSERMMRATIGRLPDGRYTFEDFLDEDDDGSGPVAIRVAVTVMGKRARVDFTGSAPQVSGPLNANYAIAMAATTYVFRSLIREDVPFTAGLMRPIEVIAPAGTVVNALPPAAMAAGNVETSQRITDVLLGALAQAAPQAIPAASSGTMNNLTFGGEDPVRRRPFAYYETIAGGMGASAAGPGQSAVHTHMTNSWNTPVEALEHQFPVRLRRYRVREGSGGGGLHRGGDGILREYEFLCPATVTILSDRRKRGPYGLAGGSNGSAGRNTLHTAPASRSGGSRTLAGKATFDVQTGDVLSIETPGGGGWGEGKAAG